ncbi:hypothetical protein V493_04005, partial [Pseudogymnoascus sp. VKM F-4281 (FW-2241)]
DSFEDSDSFSDSTVEDSIADSATSTRDCETTHSATADISSNGITKGIECPAEEANQQHMMKDSKSTEERMQMRVLSRLSDSVGEPEHMISAEEFEQPQLRSQRSLIVVLLYTPSTELARAIARVLEQLEKADDREIRGSSQLSEIDQVPEQPDPFNATEALQEPQGLPQLEPVQAPKQSDTANSTSLQEALSQPSNITIHMPSTSDLHLMWRACGCLRNQDPHPVTFVSIPAASAPSSGDLRPKSSEPSSLSLTPEDTSIIAGDLNSEEPHRHRPVLDGMSLSAENQYSADVVINQRPGHQPSRPVETDSASICAGYENYLGSKPSPPVLGLGGSSSPANLVHNKIVLPPITSFSPSHDAVQSSALPSLTPQTHLLRTIISNNYLGQYATNGSLQTPVRELTVSEVGTRKHVCTGPFWRPSPSFQERITNLLVNGIDDTEIPTPAGIIYRRDLRTLVPHVGNLNDMIINEYLKYLAQYTNARRESDIPDSCNKIAMIGSMDPIPPGLLKCLNAFSAIYLPIKWDTHWILAVLYPGSLGRQGRAEVYDSHGHWANNSMTANDVFQFLKFRLGDEFSSGDWVASVQQRSRPQRSDADSGLYVLANAKSIALTLGMVDLDSRAQSLSLNWQIAQELVTQSVVEAF